MRTMRLFWLELRRLLQSRLTWLIVLLTVLSPMVGLTLYRPATASTMLTQYLANPAIAGGAVSAAAPPLAFYALCAADPMAWIASDAVLLTPFIRNILRQDYKYLRRNS